MIFSKENVWTVQPVGMGRQRGKSRSVKTMAEPAPLVSGKQRGDFVGWRDRPDGFDLVGRARGAAPSGGEAEKESGNWCAWCLSWSGK